MNQERQPIIQPKERWVKAQLSFRYQRNFLTDDGRILRINETKVGQTHADYRLRIQFSDDNPAFGSEDVIAIDLQVADKDGVIWMCTSLCSGEVFLRHMLDIAEPSELRHYDENEHRQKLLSDELLLKDVRYYGDDRAYRFFNVGDHLYSTIFKHTSFRFDIASIKCAGGGTCRLLIRVKSTLFDKWPDFDGTNMEPLERIPDLTFEMPLYSLFRNNIALCNNEGQCYDQELPQPLFFVKTDRTGEPQDHVEFVDKSWFKVGPFRR